jgi:hypothetical protein
MALSTILLALLATAAAIEPNFEDLDLPADQPTGEVRRPTGLISCLRSLT